MSLEINLIATLIITLCVLMTGRALIARVGVLQRYSIPEPVVGGLLAATIITVARVAFDVQVSFDMSFQSTFMLAFFASVGLSADLKLLIRGGRVVVIFLAVVLGLLVLQNAIGLSAAWAMDMHPLTGLLAGSITMYGGHGTGAAYAGRFADVENLQGAMELAMACATFGLVLGGLIGGPLAQRLITRHGLKPAAATNAAAHAEGETPGGLDQSSFLSTLLMLLLCVVAGSWLAEVAHNEVFTLPAFVWTLFCGVFVRNALGLGLKVRVNDTAVSVLGGVSLSLFLTMALIGLRLWELVSLALPILAILVTQTVVALLYVTFVTFRVMGRDYDAAVICAGHCGFAMGATPTAIANMQAITAKYGPSPQAFLVIPIVGAFLLDICNALVIQMLLATPIFGF
ncbi:sodium/glutamate symporter [Achromobacter sp. GG226]|uniref:sodium/glutamate symporter n=1 Tax=Verticiella alkaliphila TaxID=2779529 RepID=UPI001C0C1D2D|nr:sodium/glutamate symporter [Verticiella sp. GG226]MBU4612497.1 sodium/glutamate symporter [Verticiella sp. GG226]